MDTLTDLENAIGTVADVNERADLWLHAGAKQTDMTNYSNAVSMFIKSRDLVANFFQDDTPKDYMISQLAYEFARARDTTRAQKALQYISDTTIADEARARIAVEVSKVNVTTAQTVINTISDTMIKDNAIANACYERAKLGDLLQAMSYSNTISDAGLITGVQNQIIRLASEVISA